MSYNNHNSNILKLEGSHPPMFVIALGPEDPPGLRDQVGHRALFAGCSNVGGRVPVAKKGLFLPRASCLPFSFPPSTA